MFHNRRHITLVAIVSFAVIGCTDDRILHDESGLKDQLTEFEIAADDLATSLLKRGILIDHNFEAFEDGTVSEDYQVVSGHGQAVKSEIEAIVRELDLSSDEQRGMKIKVIEEVDRDIVLWFHKAQGI